MSVSDVFSYVSLVHAVAGTAGGSTAMTAFYPLDVIRAHQQLNKNKSVLDIIEEGGGFSALYKGLGPVLISLGFSNFVYFYAHSLLKVLLKKLTEKKITVWQNLLLASIAGVVNVLTTCPLWVANTRLRLQEKSSSKPHYTGLVDAMIGIAKNEGVSALWGGVLASLLLVSNPTIHFVVYDKIHDGMLRAAKKMGRSSLSSFQVFVAGAIAKAAATFFTYPIQIAQARLRSIPTIKKGEKDTTDRYKNTIDVLYKIYKVDGVLGWFAGLNVKMLQTVCTAAFQFVCYERITSIIFFLLKRNAQLQIKPLEAAAELGVDVVAEQLAQPLGKN